MASLLGLEGRQPILGVGTGFAHSLNGISGASAGDRPVVRKIPIIRGRVRK